MNKHLLEIPFHFPLSVLKEKPIWIDRWYIIGRDSYLFREDLEYWDVSKVTLEVNTQGLCKNAIISISIQVFVRGKINFPFWTSNTEDQINWSTVLLRKDDFPMKRIYLPELTSAFQIEFEQIMGFRMYVRFQNEDRSYPYNVDFSNVDLYFSFHCEKKEIDEYDITYSPIECPPGKG
jgi:hypothetical protein